MSNKMLQESNRIVIRIKKSTTQEGLLKLYEGKQHGTTMNHIINTALDLAIPAMLEGKKDVSLATSIIQDISSKIEDSTRRIINNQKKLMLLQSVQEMMVGAIVSELEYFLKTHGIEISPALLEEYSKKIPERFNKIKVEMIKRLNME